MEILSGCPGGLLADGHVQLSVSAEVNGSPLMAGRHGTTQLRLIVPFEEDFFAALDSHVPRRGEAANAMMRVRRRYDMTDIDERLPGKFRVHGHAEQAPLPGAVDHEPDK